jgi:hypothetical protein
MLRTICHKYACTVLSAMIIVPKAAAETIQQSHDVKWILYKVYPRYTKVELFDTASYTSTHTRQSIGKCKNLSNSSLCDWKYPYHLTPTVPTTPMASMHSGDAQLIHANSNNAHLHPDGCDRDKASVQPNQHIVLHAEHATSQPPVQRPQFQQ